MLRLAVPSPWPAPKALLLTSSAIRDPRRWQLVDADEVARLAPDLYWRTGLEDRLPCPGLHESHIAAAEVSLRSLPRASPRFGRSVLDTLPSLFLAPLSGDARASP